jgi:hypothetical protein
VSPVGLLTAAVVVGVALVDGSAYHRVDPTLLARFASTATTLGTRPWRLATSLVITSGPRMTVTVAAGLVASLTAAAHRLGGRRALVGSVVASTVATIVCDLGLLVGRALGNPAAALAARAPDFGASALSAGAAGALARSVRPVLAAAIAVATLNGLLVNHTLADWEHLVAFGVGWLLPASRRCGRHSSPLPSSSVSAA